MKSLRYNNITHYLADGQKPLQIFTLHRSTYKNMKCEVNGIGNFNRGYCYDSRIYSLKEIIDHSVIINNDYIRDEGKYMFFHTIYCPNPHFLAEIEICIRFVD